MKHLLFIICRGLLQIIRDIDGLFTWATTWWYPQPKIVGQCKKRGVCCQNLAVGVSKKINHSEKLLKIVHWWYQFVYNFKLKGWYKKDAILIYSCNYLKNGKCSIYWRRPYICRQYPKSKRIGTTTMPGCGYSIIPSDKI